jgi:hypothetical protein
MYSRLAYAIILALACLIRPLAKCLGKTYSSISH